MASPHPIQDLIKAYLQAHPWFLTPSATPVFSQDEGDLVNKLATAMGGINGGLAILVTTPSGVNRQPESARVCLESTVEIQCYEVPLVSRGPGGSGKTAYAAARVVASPQGSSNQGLHGWRPASGGCGTLVFTGYTAETNLESGGLLYCARFTFKEVL